MAAIGACFPETTGAECALSLQASPAAGRPQPVARNRSSATGPSQPIVRIRLLASARIAARATPSPPDPSSASTQS